jgi:ABC-type hemin transport system ATPase subunit
MPETTTKRRHTTHQKHTHTHMDVNMAIMMAIVAQNRRGKNTFILFSLCGSILKVKSCEGALQWTDNRTKRTQRAPKKHAVMAIVMAIVMVVVDQNGWGKNTYILF